MNKSETVLGYYFHPALTPPPQNDSSRSFKSTTICKETSSTFEVDLGRLVPMETTGVFTRGNDYQSH